MSTLEVPGAQLYYETRGSGPPMLMIPGAPGTGRIFTGLAEHLAGDYTVVTYDRRGFSRSQLDGPQNYDFRLDTDTDDARRLIQHLSDEPATVFGSSSGGVIALEVLMQHPAVVRTLIPFEPAAMKILPDAQKWIDFNFGLYDLYRQSGMEPALKEFREKTFEESDRQLMAHAQNLSNAEIRSNTMYWFEREVREYPAADLDLRGLTDHASRILLAAGRKSRGYPCYQVNVELGAKLNRDMVELPGGHAGYTAEPAKFSREFLRALAQAGHKPDA